MENRINNAILLLKEGHPYEIGNLHLGMIDTNTLYVTGYTAYSNLDFLSKQRALNELSQIKEVFSNLVDMYSPFRDFIHNKYIEYNLAYNYGKGGVGICSEKDGKLIWWMEL